MMSSGMDGFNDYNSQPIDSESIHDFEVYDDRKEKIGKVVRLEAMLDNRSPNLIIKIGSWLSHREVALPFRYYQIDQHNRRLYLEGWTKEQVEHSSTFSTYSQSEGAYNILETATPLESSASLEAPVIREVVPVVAPIATPALLEPLATNALDDLSPAMPERPISERSIPERPIPEQPLSAPEHTVHQVASRISAEEIIPLLSERVVVDRKKRKTGEVVVRKVIETEVIEVIVRREKLIVEQVSPEYKELAVIDLGETSQQREISPRERSVTDSPHIPL